ncbi:hypothetical protein [Sphingobacterium griseoflavum]|uniref:Uncharacterized protein n=1 Tax=Sphingobacterium griseoflavum TaxID=1474952 RepID=A0ABQ3I1V6_9SPHI|nr:hypothetical protein [Sphingobacterium griseoflavum]GHE49706.1 hypothetical protein GCM10017764_35940 [Sphingobacterium griseoflavum]
MRNAVQVVLLAPIALPNKVAKILKYAAVGLGILDSLVDTNNEASQDAAKQGEEEADEAAD